MNQSRSETDPQLKCPQCGAPVTRTKVSDVGVSGPGRIEFTCPNQHRMIVELLEIDDDDLDPAV